MGMDEMFGWKTKMMNRRTAETTGAYDGGLATATTGLMAGTRVASNLGWRAVEALTVGDSVLTFDNGMQQITEVRRTVMWTDAPDTAAALWPVIVPAGALENRTELTLLADQGVLVECDAAQDIYGDPFAVIPAQSLVGVRGITRAAPQQQIELIVMSFAEEQVIYAEGAATESFHAGEMGLSAISEQSREEMFEVFPELRADVSAYGDTARQSLRAHEARLLRPNSAGFAAASSSGQSVAMAG